MTEHEFYPLTGKLPGISFEKQVKTYLDNLSKRIDEIEIVAQKAQKISEDAKDSVGVLTAENKISAGVINLTLGEFFYHKVTGAITFSISGVETGTADRFYLRLENAGSAVITWPKSVKWPNNISPTLHTTGIDYLEFITPNGGKVWYCIENKYFT